MAETERELLGSDLVEAERKLAEQTTQMGGGFYQLSKDVNWEDRYPNAIIDFVKTDGVKKIATTAGVDPEKLKPPFSISDETINDINGILESADPLTMSDTELAALRSDVNTIISDLDIPTAEQLTTFVDTFTKFVAAASSQNISFPTNFREITLVSTDTSIDNFLIRTGIRKLVAIRINKLVYPFITPRHKVSSNLQATLSGATGTLGSMNINYTGITREVGTAEIGKGSIILISNNAKEYSDLEQQKVSIDWISEDSQSIRVVSPLLFELDDTYLVQIYQYTANQVLSPGDLIKIPQ